MSKDAELIRSIEAGDIGVVSQHLREGASPSARGGPDDVPALQLAARRGATGIAALLLEFGADPNAADTAGVTALMVAAESGRADLVDVLLEAGANVNARSGEQGLTALIHAVNAGAVECVRRCLAAGADVNARSANGWSVMDYARWRKKAQWPRKNARTAWVFGRVSREPDLVIDLLRAAGAGD